MTRVRIYRSSLGFAGVLLAGLAAGVPWLMPRAVTGLPAVIAVTVAGLLGLVLAWAGFFGSSVLVHADGIELRRVGENRFIGFDRLSHLREFVEGSGKYREYGVVVVLRSGEQVKIYADATKRLVEAVRQGQRDFADAEEAREALEGAEAERRVLRRRGRSVRAWLDHLRSLAQPADGYREPARHVDGAALWRIVDSPAASAQERAGAAVALTPSLDPEERRRLRIVASSVQDARLRVALSAAAEPEATDEALCEALREVDEG